MSFLPIVQPSEMLEFFSLIRNHSGAIFMVSVMVIIVKSCQQRKVSKKNVNAHRSDSVTPFCTPLSITLT